jgi:alpha-tubulin suppressor-like RCC1 family protein/serine protease inhibitor ecotin
MASGSATVTPGLVATAASANPSLVTATATAISAGGEHTCALLTGGSVRCWGWNSYGELGNGTTTNNSTPVAVSDISTATAISAGYYHTCALLTGGSVRCWGWNYHGQLGDGTTTNSSTPVAVSGITTAIAISARGNNTCALLTGGSVRCWGDNVVGQLGNGTTTDSSTPVAVSGITTATAISAGYSHTCALLTDSSVTCWGWNYFGQLGNGTTASSSTSVAVSDISTATAISAGYGHTCALLTGGSVRCWGENYYGQLGNGTTTNNSTPVAVSDISTATAISAGDSHTCALLTDSSVTCWGYNGYGQLGNETTTNSSTSVAVGGITPATAISGGGEHTCALLTDGSVTCWGHNYSGQLGDGTTTDSTVPVSVPLYAGALDHLVLSPASTSISAGGSRAYTAEGFDASNNSLGDVTADTTFTIDSGTACPSKTCSGTVPGNHTVTGADATATGTATLHVNATAPGKPTGATATPGNGSAVVSWTAPVDNGGSAITGYTVTSTPGSYTCTTIGALSCTVSGLTSGTSYTFTVHATNVAGNGIESDASSSVTPATVPGKPTGATATAGNGSALVYWTAPVDNGGSTITGYTVTSSGDAKTCTSSATNCTVSGLTSGQPYTFTVTATNAAGTGPASDPSSSVTVSLIGATYHALTPARVLDSRDGYWIGLSGAFSSHVARTFGVTGHGGVPSNAIAVTGNLTVTGQTALGYLYVGPNATNDPTSSTLNFPTGDDRANAVTVALGAGGTLSVTYVAVPGASAQVIFDVTGYFTPDTSGATYHALTPARVLDSRDGYWIGLSGASSSHVARTFTVSGHGGVPFNAIAVTGNLTVTGQTALGYLYMGPVATNNPTSSTLNFPLGDDRANAVTVALGAGGTLSITYVAVPGASAQVIFDVTGYFTPDSTGATYVALTQVRILDSRDGTGLSGSFSSNVARTFTVSGHGGVPYNAIAVTGNLTVTGQTALGYLYMGPNATNDPTSSTLNFPLGDDRANAVTVALGAGGTLSVTYVAAPGASAQVIFDVTGYFVK